LAYLRVLSFETNFKLCRRRIVQCRFVVAVFWTILVGVCNLWVTTPSSEAQEADAARTKKAQVFVHSEILTEGDKLSDGANKTPIEIKGETTLIWVDLMPEARFAHPTEYILVSGEGTRIVKGQWWPHLNGKDLFRDGKSSKFETPITLKRK
jgi:hypothetical protein